MRTGFSLNYSLGMLPSSPISKSCVSSVVPTISSSVNCGISGISVCLKWSQATAYLVGVHSSVQNHKWKGILHSCPTPFSLPESKLFFFSPFRSNGQLYSEPQATHAMHLSVSVCESETEGRRGEDPQCCVRSIRFLWALAVAFNGLVYGLQFGMKWKSGSGLIISSIGSNQYFQINNGSNDCVIWKVARNDEPIQQLYGASFSS